MPILVIDPGHGGTAPAGGSTPYGARGASGAFEKEITLRLAQRLGRRFGRHAALTRHDDVNLSLGERVEIARRSGARVFLSLHANAGAPGERGSETWIHDHAAPSTRALAERIDDALAPVTGRGGGVRSGPMAVLDPRRLGHTDACLVEVDHLSDRAGERRLTDDRALDALADALARAVRGHLYGARYGRAVPKVTSGEYSLSLDDYMRVVISDDAEETKRINLLRRSATFVAMAQRLDRQTISPAGNIYTTINYTDLDLGRVTAGSHVGKWVLEFTAFVDLGHRFIPGTSSEAPWNANFIVLADKGGPNGPDRGDFVEGLVHETIHFDSAVSGRFPPAGTSLQQKIDAFFQEEISVRQQTLAIMAEITRGNPGDLSGYTTPTPPTVRREVERDYPSGKDRMTYLETFIFGSLITDAIAADGVTPTELNDLTRQANETSVGPEDRDLLSNIGGFVLVFDPQQQLYVIPAKKTLELFVRRKAVQERWKRLFDAGATDAEKEAAAQEHATRVFPTGIAYTP